MNVVENDAVNRLADVARSLFLQPVKPRWPCICICMYMVTVRIRVRVSVRVRVCHDMFLTRSPMFDRLQK